jgi:hypothetical protein
MAWELAIEPRGQNLGRYCRDTSSIRHCLLFAVWSEYPRKLDITDGGVDVEI